MTVVAELQTERRLARLSAIVERRRRAWARSLIALGEAALNEGSEYRDETFGRRTSSIVGETRKRRARGQ
jgi:hypothetical protein